jgi:hypothetical protein
MVSVIDVNIILIFTPTIILFHVSLLLFCISGIISFVVCILRISYTYCLYEIEHVWGVLDTTLCDKVCQWPATDLRFSQGTLVSHTNKTDGHDITELVLKVALNTITLTLSLNMINWQFEQWVQLGLVLSTIYRTPVIKL